MDSSVVAALYGWASSQPTVASLVVLVAQVGIFLVPLALVAAWLVSGPRPSARRELVLAGGIAFALSLALSFVLERVAYRPRPFVTLALTPLFQHGRSSSFPSDHTLLGVALAAPLLWRRSLLGLSLAAWTLLVGFARVAAGVHYPTDILGSAVIGGLIGWLALPIAPRLAAIANRQLAFAPAWLRVSAPARTPAQVRRPSLRGARRP